MVVRSPASQCARGVVTLSRGAQLQCTLASCESYCHGKCVGITDEQVAALAASGTFLCCKSDGCKLESPVRAFLLRFRRRQRHRCCQRAPRSATSSLAATMCDAFSASRRARSQACSPQRRRRKRGFYAVGASPPAAAAAGAGAAAAVDDDEYVGARRRPSASRPLLWRRHIAIYTYTLL